MQSGALGTFFQQSILHEASNGRQGGELPMFEIVAFLANLRTRRITQRSSERQCWTGPS